MPRLNIIAVESRKQYNLPDNGPAIHTNDMYDFDNPNESKYGVPKRILNQIHAALTQSIVC